VPEEAVADVAAERQADRGTDAPQFGTSRTTASPSATDAAFPIRTVIAPPAPCASRVSTTSTPSRAPISGSSMAWLAPVSSAQSIGGAPLKRAPTTISGCSPPARRKGISARMTRL
jgi:hypothetical protein